MLSTGRRTFMTINTVFPLPTITHTDQAIVDEHRAGLVNVAAFGFFDAGLQQFGSTRTIHACLDGIPVDFAERGTLASQALVSYLLAAPP